MTSNSLIFDENTGEFRTSGETLVEKQSVVLILDESTGQFVPDKSVSSRVLKNITNLRAKKKKTASNRNNWQVNIRKNANIHGESFLNQDGNIRPMKSIRPPCTETCRIHCSERVTEELRQQFFNKYYSVSSNRQKWEFLLRYTRSDGVDRKKENSRRHCSRKYFIGTENFTHAGEEFHKVCKKMFLNTLCISDNVVRTAHEKIQNKNGVVSQDMRGGHVRIESQVKQTQKEWVHKHINSFPKVSSHYVRARCDKMFLDRALSVTKMHQLYQEFIPSPDLNVTMRVYRNIFNNDFDLYFHALKKDTCDKCTKYEVASPFMRRQFEDDHAFHIKQKDTARALKNEYRETPNTMCAIFDYQKGITLPRADASSFYYKRKLTLHNFTIYDTNNKEALNFMYDESLTGAGPNEVCSCLYLFIKANVALGVKKFLFVSDNCPAQNHNKFLFAFYVYCAAQFNININHLFLVCGHTQMEVDSVHSVIERALKKMTLFVPEQVYNIVRAASKKKSYKVVELELKDVLNFKVNFII